MVELNFNASEHEPVTGAFEPVPAGDYTVICVDSEIKENSKNTGSHLKLVWEIVDETEFRGRRIFENLNIWNSNADAVRIANGTLTAICNTVGIAHLKDSDELHNKPVKISVKLEARKDRPGEFGNRIKEYMAAGAGIPATNPITSPAAPGAARPDASTPPWKR